MLKLGVNKIIEKLKQNRRYRIAFVGDSLTSCEWVHPNWREIVEYVLKEELQNKFENWQIPSWGIRCFNFGFDGSTTRDILDKADEILEIKPDIIICLMGGNDPLLGVKVEETKSNIENLMNKFKGVEVFWMTNLPELREWKNKEYEEYKKITIEIDGNENQIIFDSITEYRKNDLSKLFTLITDEYKLENYKIDPTHPNQLGNAYIAKMVLKEVFGIEFDPEIFIKTTLGGEKYPKY